MRSARGNTRRDTALIGGLRSPQAKRRNPRRSNMGSHELVQDSADKEDSNLLGVSGDNNIAIGTKNVSYSLGVGAAGTDKTGHLDENQSDFHRDIANHAPRSSHARNGITAANTSGSKFAESSPQEIHSLIEGSKDNDVLEMSLLTADDQQSEVDAAGLQAALTPTRASKRRRKSLRQEVQSDELLQQGSNPHLHDTTSRDIDTESLNEIVIDTTSPRVIITRPRQPRDHTQHLLTAQSTADSGLCSEKGCTNVVSSRGRCRTHNGRRCSHPGCSSRPQGGPLCKAHGGGRRCKIVDCNRLVQSRGLCCAHGGGRRCSFQGCSKIAQADGACRDHGGGVRCDYPNCSFLAKTGGLCVQHGGGKRCDTHGCSRQALKGGMCHYHGGGPRCEAADCDKLALKGGFCHMHGGGQRCTRDDCEALVVRIGLCLKHSKEMGCADPDCTEKPASKGKYCPHHARAYRSRSRRSRSQSEIIEPSVPIDFQRLLDAEGLQLNEGFQLNED